MVDFPLVPVTPITINFLDYRLLMFSQELSDYILRGKEEIYLEYKQSMKWNINAKSDAEKVVNFTIVRTMLAMSNNKDGGVIVVGRGQKSNGEFDMAGVKKVDLNSYKQDDIARFLNGVSDPPIHFSIERDYLNIKGKKKWFVVIRVPESEYLPVICIKKDCFGVPRDIRLGKLLRD